MQNICQQLLLHKNDCFYLEITLPPFSMVLLAHVYCFTGSPQFAVFLVNSLNAKVAIIPFNELQFNELIVNLRHEVFLMSLLCIYHIFSESCVICRCWKSMLFWFQHWCYQKALFCRWLGIEKMLRKLEFYEKLCMKI